MTDIFLSYSHQDSEFAEALTIALTEYGWSVWFDRTLKQGGAFDEQIERAISEAIVTLVIWSPSSVKSRWVRSEAAFALDRTRLIPVLIGGVDPPLQFLQIQGFDFSGWDHSLSGHPFRELSSLLASYLDNGPGGPSNNISIEQHADAILHPVREQLSLLAKSIYPAVDLGFSVFFRDRTFFVTRFAVGLSFCVYGLLGVADFFASAGGLALTRFRFMVGGPSLLLMLALSFSSLAKVYSQIFTVAFCTIAIAISVITLRFVTSELLYQPIYGTPTMNFMLIVGFLSLIPLRIVPMLIVGISTFAIYTWIAMTSHLPQYLLSAHFINFGSALVLCFSISFFREWLLRITYIEMANMTSRNKELKDRLFALSAERIGSNVDRRAESS